MKRKTISKRTRFEVFKRDSFPCQYCGQKSPDVILEIDHIKPLSKGGDDKILNLVTACYDCNHGKSNKELSDDSTVKQQQRQTELLQLKREQLEMMYKWQKSLLEVESMAVEKLAGYWSELLAGRSSINSNGIKRLRLLEKKFGIADVMRAMKTAVDNYVQLDKSGYIHESVEIAFKKVGGICYVNRQDSQELRDIYYIRKIVINRLSYVDPVLAKELIEKALELGHTKDKLRNVAALARNWTDWREQMYKLSEEF